MSLRVLGVLEEIIPLFEPFELVSDAERASLEPIELGMHRF